MVPKSIYPFDLLSAALIFADDHEQADRNTVRCYLVTFRHNKLSCYDSGSQYHGDFLPLVLGRLPLVVASVQSGSGARFHYWSNDFPKFSENHNGNHNVVCTRGCDVHTSLGRCCNNRIVRVPENTLPNE